MPVTNENSNQLIRFRMQEAKAVSTQRQPDFDDIPERLACVCAIVSGCEQRLGALLPSLVIATDNRTRGLLIEERWNDPSQTIGQIERHFRSPSRPPRKEGKVLIVDQVLNMQLTPNQFVLPLVKECPDLITLELAEHSWSTHQVSKPLDTVNDPLPPNHWAKRYRLVAYFDQLLGEMQSLLGERAAR
ncbi:MAG: hypothetical protein PHZ00_03300 [Candidatus Peribacteraceae bacterium]|nr:hypothetical protein [Candidatus Peribacteraceae bacterium]